jgi:hypothetical protein
MPTNPFILRPALPPSPEQRTEWPRGQEAPNLLERLFKRPQLDSVARPLTQQFPDEVASEAVKIMGDVWKNEETRFNNLNTRAIALISATSVVTTILGFYSKNLFDTSGTRTGFQGAWREWGAVGLICSVLLLSATIFVTVFGVLLPRPRPVFGDNALTEGTVPDVGTVDRTAFDEYGALYAGLASRTARKAFWIDWAYVLFALGVSLSIVVTVLLVVDVGFLTKPVGI